MRGLTIIVAGADRQRFRTALTLGAAQAALGASARIFLDEGAVGLATVLTDAADCDHFEKGLPTTPELLETALELGVGITLCQTGLALNALNLETLDARFEVGGLPLILASLGDQRLIAL